MKLVPSIAFLFLSASMTFAADRAPTVFLTHFFIALDRATYEALRSSPGIAALAAVEERHTVAGTRTWTGFYVWGRETYMEFFGANALPDKTHLGDCGLALTVEESGGIAAIASRLRETFGKKVWGVHATPRTMPTGTIPWFTATGVDSDTPDALGTWCMEVDPKYLATRHPGSPVEQPLSRQQYLSWDFRPERPLDNVTALTAALNSAESSQLATELELTGWSAHRKDGGFVAVGPDVKLTVLPAGTRASIQEVEFRLRNSVPAQSRARHFATPSQRQNGAHYILDLR